MTVLSVPTLLSRLRRTRRWLRWVGFALAVFVTLAYTLLPWYVPGPWLAGQTAAILGQSLGRPAHVERASLSWTDGVCIEGVTVDDLPGEGRPPQLLRIGRIRFGLSPIKTLLRGKVDRLELDGPQLWIAVLPDGRLNIDDLDSRRQAGLPTFHFMLRNTVLHLNLPDLPARCGMDVAECRLDRRTGLLWISGDATISPRGSAMSTRATSSVGRFWLNGRIKVPRLKRGVKLTGGGELRWENVDLKAIPFRMFPQVGIDSLEGRSDGYVHLEAFPDLGVDYDLRVRLDGVAVHRLDRAAPERIQDGQFSAGGHWDPAADMLVAKTLDYRMPALRIHDLGRADRPALVLDGAATEPLRLDLAGEVEDLVRLRRESPAVDDVLRRLDLEVGQGGRFTLLYSQSPQVSRTRLAIDADGVAVTRGDSVCLGAGVSKRLAVDVSRSIADGGIDLREARLDVADLHWTASASLPASPDIGGSEPSWIADAVAAAAAELSFKTPSVEQLAVYFPGIDRRLGPGARRGPVECLLSLEPTPGGPAFRLRLASPGEAVLEFGDGFRKPQGVPLSANASWLWDASSPGRWKDLAGEVAVGEARLALDGPRAAVQYAVTEAGGGAPSDEAFDASLRVHLPIIVSRIEQLVPRFPRVAALLDECRGRLAGAPTGDALVIAGDAGLVLDGTLSYQRDDWAWRGQMRADLAPARIRAGDLLDKAAGAPASLSVEHGVARVGAQIEHELAVRAALPGIEANGRYVLSGSAAGALAFRTIDTEELRVGVGIADARQALSVLPAWARSLADRELAGGASMRLAFVRTSDGDSASLAVDAGGLQVAVPGREPFFKAIGVPCAIEALAHSDKEHTGLWVFDSGGARLATGSFRWQGGEVAISSKWAAWLSAVGSGDDTATPTGPRWQAPPAGRLLRRAEVTGAFDVEVDSTLRKLTPVLEAWASRLGLAGRVTGSLHAVASPESVRVSGTLDAGPANVSVALPGKLQFVKPVGTEASLAVDVEHRRDEASPGGTATGSVVIHEVRLTARDNEVDLRGQLDLGQAGGGAPAIRQGSLHVHSALNRLDRLQSLLPDYTWPPVRGVLAADVTVDLRDGRWHVGESDVVLRDVAMSVDDTPVHANGRLEFSESGVLCDALAIRAGTSEMTLSGRAAFSADSPVVQLGIHAPHIDIDEVRHVQSALSGRLGDRQREGSGGASRFWDFLGRASLDVGVQIDRMQLMVPDLGLRADMRATSGAVTAHEGVVEMPVQASVDGGVVSGRIKFFLREGKPYFDLAYTAESLAPRDLVQAYLRRSFPGFVASGPLTLIDRSLQRIGVPSEQRNYPVGSGEWIIEGGYVEGKAAPDWVTRIFPGLNLTRYDFLRMHDWFTKEENGRVEHRMIFQGRFYHLYMEGYTDADRNIRYEVGIDLLAQLDSKYWVESQQGRIPLFIKTGRIREDGTLESDVVQFTPMPRVIENLVQNNVVRTMYYAVRQQVLNLTEKRRGVQ